MFRNYLAAALRNLSRNRLYSGIGILGLAVGLCAVILTGLVCRNHLTYERHIPGYENTYLALSILAPQGREAIYDTTTHNSSAAELKLRFSEIDAVTRLAEQSTLLRNAAIETKEKIYWADPNFFDLLPLPAYAGDLKSALRSPDRIVLTRSMARKYFGRDAPLEETILVDGNHSMTVAAVIEDPPINATLLDAGVFASGLSSYSELTKLDNDPVNSPESKSFSIPVLTYARLSAKASPAAMNEAMPELLRRIWPHRPPGLGASMQLVRIDRVHLFPQLNPGLSGRLAVIVVIGALILFVACINFVNLVTARSARRALEVGVRKASGASRTTLVVQFLGESSFHVLVAAFIAVALAELLLPHLNAFLKSGAVFDYWRDPALMGTMVPAVVVLGAFVGAYPAWVLSRFRPASVLKGQAGLAPRAGAPMRLLVILQFAILIALIIAAAVVYQQRRYATHEAVRVRTDEVLVIASDCEGAFKDEVRALPGVRGTACAGWALLVGKTFTNIELDDGAATSIDVVPVEPELFGLYEVKPVAGRFSQSHPKNPVERDARVYIINEAAVRRLGFASPQAAIGKTLKMPWGNDSTGEYQIIAVIPDFALDSALREVKPTVYFAAPESFQIINVKLAGRQIPETLEAIDDLWRATGATQPIVRFFLDAHIRQLYDFVLREAQVFGFFACLAVLLACLGLFGLSASITEQRTKEIGIRKAMGAGTGDVMRLLIWQFAKPVLWANLIAWPVAAVAMSRWLNGFARHVDLQVWVFAGASALALAIGLLTVSAHCYLVSRAKPVTSLRYE